MREAELGACLPSVTPQIISIEAKCHTLSDKLSAAHREAIAQCYLDANSKGSSFPIAKEVPFKKAATAVSLRALLEELHSLKETCVVQPPAVMTRGTPTAHRRRSRRAGPS